MNLPKSIITTLVAGAGFAQAVTEEHEIPLLYGMDFNDSSNLNANVADETNATSPSFTASEPTAPVVSSGGLSLNSASGYYTMGADLDMTNGLTFVSTVDNKQNGWNTLWAVQLDNDRYLSMCANGANGFSIRTTTFDQIAAPIKSHNYSNGLTGTSLTTIVTMQYVAGGNIDITLRIYDGATGAYITQSTYSSATSSDGSVVGVYDSGIGKIVVGNGGDGLAGNSSTLDNFGVYGGLVTEETMDWLALNLSEGKSIAEVQYIPEPSTATLSLLALSGLLARRRRKNG